MLYNTIHYSLLLLSILSNIFFLQRRKKINSMQTNSNLELICMLCISFRNLFTRLLVGFLPTRMPCAFCMSPAIHHYSLRDSPAFSQTQLSLSAIERVI